MPWGIQGSFSVPPPFLQFLAVLFPILSHVSFFSFLRGHWRSWCLFRPTINKYPWRGLGHLVWIRHGAFFSSSSSSSSSLKDLRRFIILGGYPICIGLIWVSFTFFSSGSTLCRSLGYSWVVYFPFSFLLQRQKLFAYAQLACTMGRRLFDIHTRLSSCLFVLLFWN